MVHSMRWAAANSGKRAASAWSTSSTAEELPRTYSLEYSDGGKSTTRFVPITCAPRRHRELPC
eukprot:scaffold895_cov286-Prasinococcus_capsulatus_cf.AAC.6